MAFKISAGTGDVSYDAWSQPGVHDGGPGCSPHPGIPCRSIYKDVAADEWNNIEQVGNMRKGLSSLFALLLSLSREAREIIDWLLTQAEMQSFMIFATTNDEGYMIIGFIFVWLSIGKITENVWTDFHDFFRIWRTW